MARTVRLCACATVLVLAACVTVASATASAATLQWLVGGTKITEALAAEMVGELTIGTENGGGIGIKAAVLCSFVATGTVGPGTEALVTIMLNLAKAEELTLAKPALCVSVSACEGNENEVAPVNLPWLIRLELMGTEAEPLFLSVFENGGKGNPGVEVSCKTFLGNVTETCTVEKGGANVVNDASENDGLGSISKEVVATCTNGGANSGWVESSANDESLLLTTSGGALAVSYE